MADTEVRLPCDSGTGDDDSPPVCLVQLNTSRIPPETTKENLNSSKNSLETTTCRNIACFSPSATEDSPEFSRMGNSTPEKTLTEDESYSPRPGVSITGANCTRDSSTNFQTSTCTCFQNESPNLINMSQECPGSLAPSPSDSSDPDSATTATLLGTAPRSSDLDQGEVNKFQSNPAKQIHLVSSVSNFEDIEPTEDGLEKDNEKKVGLTEDEDEFDLEEHPLTVDVPQEPEGNTNLYANSTKTFPAPMEHDSIDSAVKVDAIHHDSVPTNMHQGTSVTAANAVSHCTDQPIESTRIEPRCTQDAPSPMTNLKTSSTIQDKSDVTTSESTSTDAEVGTKETGVEKSCPVTAAASPSFEADALSCSVVTSLHSMIGISSSPLSTPVTRSHSSLTELDTVKNEKQLTETSSSTGLMNVASSSHISETTATIISTLTSNSPLTPTMSLVCQSTVHLMPFVATSIPGPPTSMLGNLTTSHTGLGTSALSLNGGTQPGASNGSGSLQIFNMAPMPQFVGTPGIVLHATGTVTGAPGYPSSTPLLPGLPTAGNASGLSGSATLNFLQPHQSFTTTLLPQSAHGSDYLFDLGLSQTSFPPNSNSITLFNPVESLGAATVPHALYPTIIQPPTPTPQPHSQSLFPTSCGPNPPISAPLFVSPPSYRPTVGGVTNLVSSTTPQMTTSLGSGSGPFAPPNLPSLGTSATPSGFLFQTTHPHQHQPTQHLIPSCGPLLQSCQFPPYPMPFQGTDPCLPLAASTLSGFRTVDQSIETTVSSVANIHTNPGLPQLWASSTAPVSFSPIQICPNTLSQSTTFPISVSVNSTTVAPTATVTTPLTTASTVLPHPPALQPCPALTKRFQPLCPLPTGRGSLGSTTGGFLSSPTRRSSGLTVRPQLSSTGITSSNVQNSEKRKVISAGITTVIRSRQPLRSGTSAKPELTTSACTLAAVPSTFCTTMTIRTPNSVTVIPAIRRRRPLAKVTSSMKTVNKPDIQSVDGPLTSSSTVPTDHTLRTTGDPTTTVSETKATSVVTVSVSSPSGECIVSSPSIKSAGPPTLASSPVDETHCQLPTTTDTMSLARTPVSIEPFVTCLDDYESPAHTSSTKAPGTAATSDAISVSNSVIAAPTESHTIDAMNKIESCDKVLNRNLDTSLNPKSSHLDAPMAVKFPRDQAPFNFPVSNSSPLASNHIPRHSGSPISAIRVTESTQSSSVSPNREFFLTNGIQQRDSTELQASLERLGVSGNHQTKEPRSVTLTHTTHPQKSSQETAGLLHVTRSNPVKSGHTIGSAFRSPPPLLHHGPDDRRVLTHYIDGHVIYESNKPFPVKHGMAVVEAALLHQCIEEEKLGYLTADVLDTSECLPRHNRTLSKPLTRSQSPTSSSFNGEQPMQLDAPLPVSISERNKFSDQDVDARGPKSQNFAGHLEDRSPMHHSSSEVFMYQNGNSAPLVAAGAFESIIDHATTDNTQPESFNHPANSAVSTEDDASYTKSLDAACLPSSTTPTRVPSPVQQDRAQHLPALASLASNSGVRSGRKPDETDSNYQPILPKIPIPVVSRKSSPAQNPTPHGPQPIVSATQPFVGLFTHPYSHPLPQVPEPPPPGPVRYWSADDVVAFVRGTPGCGAYAEAFHTNEIDGEALLLLAEDQFIQPPIGMKLGPALKLAARLETLRNVI